MSSELIANLIAVVVGLGVGTPILVKGLRAGDKPAIYLGNHQGLDNRLIENDEHRQKSGAVQCRERLGGLLKYYYRDVA